jgi:hypothetical protein
MPTMLPRSLVLALSLLGTVGCDSKPAPAEPAKAETKPAAPNATHEPEEPHDEPKALAPAPAGAMAIGRVYVQTCADPEACPTLLQDAGVAHCKALGLGGLSWRLPTLEELESWRGNPALVGYDVFHWSSSAWNEDPAQFWMYDPGSGAKTTAKPDRKPFTIRCVA